MFHKLKGAPEVRTPRSSGASNEFCHRAMQEHWSFGALNGFISQKFPNSEAPDPRMNVSARFPEFQTFGIPGGHCPKRGVCGLPRGSEPGAREFWTQSSSMQFQMKWFCTRSGARWPQLMLNLWFRSSGAPKIRMVWNAAFDKSSRARRGVERRFLTSSRAPSAPERAPERAPEHAPERSGMFRSIPERSGAPERFGARGPERS